MPDRGKGFETRTYHHIHCNRVIFGSPAGKFDQIRQASEFLVRFRFPFSFPFAPIPPVKFAASLLVLLAFSLTACNTPANRRDLYKPNQASGPYTNWLRHGGKWPRSDARATPAPQSTAPSEAPPAPQ